MMSTYHLSIPCNSLNKYNNRKNRSGFRYGGQCILDEVGYVDDLIVQF